MPEGTVKTNIRRGLEQLHGVMARAGYACAVPVVVAALSDAQAVSVPTSLQAFIKGLAVPAGSNANTSANANAGDAVVSGAVKGGMAMKVMAGMVFAGAVAAGLAAMSGGGPGDPRAGFTKDWRQEQWTVEDFTAVLGGGPPIGPAVEAGGGASAMCGDKAGNLYLLNGNRIDIVTPDGVKHPLAGAGRGYRDGPASQALFDQGGGYNVARSIQCDANGNIYTAENGNHRVRRVYRDKDGKWMVDTVAGGGKKWLNPGEACAPLEAKLSNNIAVAAAPDGTLTIAGPWAGFLRIAPDRKSIRRLGSWPKTVNGKDNPILVCADADLAGNAYFIWRGPPTDGIVRVSAEGKIEHIAGLSLAKMKAAKGKPHHIGDGPPREAYFDTPTSMAANPDGSCVYSCGGDEYDIRRIPTDMKSTTATLVCNGRWYVMPVHPNRNRTYPHHDPFNPKLTGKSKAEKGKLANLMNCHINGRDYQGNLYGSLYSWVGATQWVAGKGQLRTQIYRIRRLK